MLCQKISTKPTHTLGVKHNKQARKKGVRHNYQTLYIYIFPHVHIYISDSMKPVYLHITLCH